jgi:phosphate:Na+ symporter
VLFIIGMKLMSETLQRLAEETLRSILAKTILNKSGVIISGLTVTSLVQPSSQENAQLAGIFFPDLVSRSATLKDFFCNVAFEIANVGEK